MKISMGLEAAVHVQSIVSCAIMVVVWVLWVCFLKAVPLLKGFHLEGMFYAQPEQRHWPACFPTHFGASSFGSLRSVSHFFWKYIDMLCWEDNLKKKIKHSHRLIFTPHRINSDSLMLSFIWSAFGFPCSVLSCFTDLLYCIIKSLYFTYSTLLHPPKRTHGNHWSFTFSVVFFPFSRMSYNWNHTVCNLFTLASST